MGTKFKRWLTWYREMWRDPLWAIWNIAIDIEAVISIFHLAGAIDSFSPPFSVIDDAAGIAFWAPLLAGAVRGEGIGDRKPMSLEARVGWGGVSALVIILMLETNAQLLF